MNESYLHFPFKMLVKTPFLSIALLAAATNAADPNAVGLMDEIHQKLDHASGNLRRSLSLFGGGPDFSICDMLEHHLSSPFHRGQPTSKCTCEGDLKGTTNLDCSFSNVCDDYDMFCVDAQVNATLKGILDENGFLGKDPELKISSCMDTNVQMLETMCLEMGFSKPDFFVLKDCSFSYGGQECVCVVDKSAPCYTFDCSSVLPEIVSNTCKEVDLNKGGADPTMFIPALADFPDDFDGRLDLTSGVHAINSAKIVDQVVAYEEAEDQN